MENAREILQEDSFQKSELEKRETTKRSTPKRIIHFANGDTMHEYSTEEEEEDDEKEEFKNSSTLAVREKKVTYYCKEELGYTYEELPDACDFLGGKVATFFGLDEPKYQYLLNEYYRTQNQKNGKQPEEGDSKAQSTEAADEKQRLDVYGKQYGTSEQKTMVDFTS